MEQTDIKRLYYSISEVSNLVDEEQYVLRYWETEFEQLRPQKNRAGNRIYNDKDIQIITAIQQLLRIKRFTIDGAKEHLKTMQFDKKPLEGEPSNGEIHSEMPVSEVTTGNSIIAEPNTELAVPEPQETSAREILQETTPRVTLQETPPQETNMPEETPHSTNGDGYAFSRTMQAEWHEPLDATALLSITPLSADLTPTELPISEQLVSNQSVGEQSVSDQVPTSETTLNSSLPEQPQSTEQPQGNDNSSPLETKNLAAFSREELLSLRDTLHSILRLIEPPQSDESLALDNTTETTI